MERDAFGGGIAVEEALRAQKALRAAAGLGAELFPPEAFVGMISDEIEALRKQGLKDDAIAKLIFASASIPISAEEISRYYATPAERGRSPKGNAPEAECPAFRKAAVVDLAALRQDYSQRGLRRSELDPDPIRQFNAWLAEAIGLGLLEPNAMTLATVDASGQMWSRTVLLKICDARGFAFFTNYTGDKARQMEGNPRVALTFWWGALERQVNVTGTVTRTSREESEAYFHSRPASSQLGAWASAQSAVVADRAQLERQYEEALARFGETQIPLPPHWGGYRLAPQTVEFWQGRRSRLHDRLRYSRQPGDGWKIERLSP